MDPLLDRELLFGNPDRGEPLLSPDGAFVAFTAPDEGVMNLWVAPVHDVALARPVTSDRGRGIVRFTWALSGERILYVQDTDGDENWRLYAARPDGGEATPLTPAGAQALVLATSPRRPHELLVLSNEREARLHDPYLVDLRTGERRRLLENPGLVGWAPDHDLRLRIGLAMGADGGMDVLRITDGALEPVDHVPPEDTLTTRPIGFDADGVEYWLDSRGRDTAALVRVADGERTVLSEARGADVAAWLVHPATGRPQAAYATFDEERVHVLDPALIAHFQHLGAHRKGTVDVGSRSLDDRSWIVSWRVDDGPVPYAVYDTAACTIRELFTNRTALVGLPLTRRRPVVARSRDGLDLVSYLSLPRWLDDGGRPRHPLPMVVLVHGGPWFRDEPGYDPLHQLLANRGYAVLSVNFRGSTGFGKAFLNAGNLEWAGKMQDDLDDAVDWAVAEGIARPDKVAIMGGSYGGYAALVGLAFTPERYACGVDLVGPSSLLTLLGSIPPYWAPMKAQFHARVGNDETEEGRAFLWSRSPLARAHEIRRPLLIAQGANDPRVKQAESDQIVAELRRRGVPVSYALVPDEGHGFERPENRLAFVALTEAFLAEHLGGRAQPDDGACARSSVRVT